ncbi:MAG: UvrD-helicase domain-containing protein [Leptonema sp. (in: Bacteria)]|nr:UvrD-helicase domain-containing protein [Leptonema sp. (in: bacteria)]
MKHEKPSNTTQEGLTNSVHQRLQDQLIGEFLDGLNSVQKQAVLHQFGPLLIFAGAGSGKTRVITHRIAYLIRVHQVSAKRILAVTFTNKAATEMRERTSALVGPYAEGSLIRTFHSLGLQILRENISLLGMKSSFTVFDTAAQKSLAKKILKDQRIEPALLPPEAALSATERARERLVDPQAYLTDARRDPYHQAIANFYLEYQKRLRDQQAFDFSDLLYESVKLLEREPNLLEMSRRRWQYLLVDEYQDTNHAQYRLVQLLAGSHQNVVVVGDDDQSIYSWRGADIGNILNFEHDFPNTKVLRLEENYRSTPSILKLAASVIQHNSDRKPKTLFTNRPDIQPPTFRIYQEEGDEARSIVTKIRELQREGIRLNQIAIFYRTNAQSRIFEQVFREANIPHTIFGGFRFFDRKEIRILIAYLQILANPMDSENLERVLSNPPKGIGEKTMETARFLVGSSGVSYIEALRKLSTQKGFRGAKAVDKFLAHYEGWVQAYQTYERPSELLQLIINESGLIDYYRGQDDPDSISRIENIQEFITVVKDFEERAAVSNERDELSVQNLLPEFLQTISLYTSETNPQTQNDNKESEHQEDETGVNLMTLHNAKGLEFKVVFFTGLEEGLLPHRMSVDEGNVEEERRLVYVGITRAKEQLYVSCCRFRRFGGSFEPKLPSRFLEEMGMKVRREQEITQSWNSGSSQNFGTQLPNFHKSSSANQSVEFSIDDRIRHQSFGDGIIEDIESTLAGKKLTIRFDDGTTRRFLDRYTPLQKL